MKNILLSLILLSTVFVSFGCQASPSQKYKIASDLYQTSGEAVAAAINADLVDTETAIAIGRIDNQAHSALIQWRINYPMMSDEQAHSEIERVLAIIRGIRAVVTEAPQLPAELEPN